MNDPLHITNGESANDALGRAGAPGESLSWDDVLHEGPTPAGLSLKALSERRARFIADHFGADPDETRARFRARDDALRNAFNAGRAMVLWNSPELYDQLHLLQLLSWFDERSCAKLSIVFIDELIGCANDEALRAAHQRRQPAEPGQLALATRVWAAFRSPDPTALQIALANENLAPLPFLRMGLERLRQEYPDSRTGLSRTERQILTAAADGVTKPGDLFRASQAMESPPFMGDWSFWRALAGLIESPAPLMATADGQPFRSPPRSPGDRAFRRQSLALTACGRDVLAGRRDWLATHSIDRWIGGVHLRAGATWRWDSDRLLFCRPSADRQNLE